MTLKKGTLKNGTLIFFGGSVRPRQAVLKPKDERPLYSPVAHFFPIAAIAAFPAASISDGVMSLMCEAIDHWCPNGSVTMP